MNEVLDKKSQKSDEEIKENNHVWKVIVFTNKGQFVSPKRFYTEAEAYDYVDVLKKYHATQPLFQREGQRGIKPYMYIVAKGEA